jgi:hypothetical protein
MNYKKQCECCGHQVTAYSHNINAQLADALEQLVNFYIRTARGCNLQKDLKLSKNQYNNFQKLQYFALVHNEETGWFPTSRGVNFINGEIAVEAPVATFGKEILNSWHPAWQTAEKRPAPLHITQVKNYNWKGREEYKEEKRTTLF